MIPDTSPLVAILAQEPHSARYIEAIGMGRHAAGLNFGDCFAYGLAKISGEPVLYKGEDFQKTDVLSAR